MIDAKLQDVSSKMSPEVRSGRVKALTLAIREFREELKRVSWTTKEELKLFTKIVVGAIFAFGIGIYLVDLSIKGLLQFIGRIVH